jgi:hypothetical protein
MEGKCEAMSTRPQIVNNVKNVNNIIVFPTEFGKENMEYVTEKLGNICENLIKCHPYKSIPHLFNMIHNNDKLPEYHNVYANSERSGYVLVSNGKSFQYCPKKTIIDQIIEDKRSILNKYVDEKGEQLGERVLKKYERYQDSIDDDPKFKKELELEIGGMLLSLKSVIANDERTRKLLDKVTEGNFDLGEVGESDPPTSPS